MCSASCAIGALAGGGGGGKGAGGRGGGGKSAGCASNPCDRGFLGGPGAGGAPPPAAPSPAPAAPLAAGGAGTTSTAGFGNSSALRLFQAMTCFPQRSHDSPCPARGGVGSRGEALPQSFSARLRAPQWRQCTCSHTLSAIPLEEEDGRETRSVAGEERKGGKEAGSGPKLRTSCGRGGLPPHHPHACRLG